MLYLIIPPTLVVLSLFGIIIFLMKKAPEVARLEDRKDFPRKEVGDNSSDFSPQRKMLGQKEAILRKKSGLIISGVVSKSREAASGAGGFFSRIFSTIGQKVKERRENKKDTRNNSPESTSQGLTYEELFRRREDKQVKIVDEERYFQEESQPEERVENRANQRSGKTEPKRETESKVEKKDLFENILIERIAANPKDIEAYERLGEYYLEIENWEYAKECFKQVLKLNPRNIGIRSKMRKLERILSK